MRNPSKSRGIHSVYSGFNEAFREYFGEDPIQITQELASQGKIETRFVKGGVMIYLPSEAPTSRSQLGKAALSKILGKQLDHESGLIDEFLNQICLEAIKIFPEDFLGSTNKEMETMEVEVPGTILQLDSNSQTLVISPKGHFRYEARNPSEAKYIIYAHNVGKLKIKIPKDNRVLFNAVAEYNKYSQAIREQSFAFFLKRTNDEEMADLLSKEVEQKLDLRAKRE